MAEPLVVIQPRVHDIGGGLMVRRALPHLQARSVGPFVFLDEFGPLHVPPGANTDVRPHPHIGLATITLLFAGEMLHRDSLGTVQEIRPGDINLMCAGRGIVHSERSPLRARQQGQHLHGLQTWIALPQSLEDADPWFAHYPAGQLPRAAFGGGTVQLLIGRGFGLESPVQAPAVTLYAVITLNAGAELALDVDYPECAAYVIDGVVDIAGQTIAAGRLALLPRPLPLLRASVASRVVLVGGEPLDGPRILWWNFVASTRDRIERAKQSWREQTFAAVPDETEFIPLPES